MLFSVCSSVMWWASQGRDICTWQICSCWQSLLFPLALKSKCLFLNFDFRHISDIIWVYGLLQTNLSGASHTGYSSTQGEVGSFVSQHCWGSITQWAQGTETAFFAGCCHGQLWEGPAHLQHGGWCVLYSEEVHWACSVQLQHRLSLCYDQPLHHRAGVWLQVMKIHQVHCDMPPPHVLPTVIVVRCSSLCSLPLNLWLVISMEDACRKQWQMWEAGSGHLFSQ